MAAIETYLNEHSEAFLKELFELLRIPSISADPDCANDMATAARWVADKLAAIGMKSEVIPTKGHPIVYGESPKVDGAPTVLVYGHYDVQPVDPLDQWVSPPFDPEVRQGRIYARGATDDKGQMLTHLLSAQAWLQTEGRLPVNLKYLIEGEEEVGSEALSAYVAENTEKLACDCIVVSDSGQFGPGQPAITYGLRGITCCEIVVQGPNRDLHSGSFGGSITNPALALARILSGLIGDDGKVQVPGFYDDVVPLTDLERKQMAELPFDETQYMGQVGVPDTWGEAGFTALERRWARPTFEINGLTSGYQGTGGKTIIPARASAKISFRLVPNQSPETINEGIRAMVEKLALPGVKVEVRGMHGAPGLLVPLDSPYVAAASKALEHAFGRAPVMTREGGSIPVVATLHKQLAADTLLLGWGQDDDNAHSPNERFLVEDFYRGIRASARLWEEIAQI
ncbi:MAG: dipeptidase [Planctomycetaceae bacterium]|nr:dipeptidase [Planctomycetaceae bacterium]